MEYGQLMLWCIEFMKTEFVLCGFTVSFWMMFIFMCIVIAIFALINAFLD